MPAPTIIHQLVAKFEENREAYRSGKYNEARLRQEFLDPFFEALGWDVYNKAGLAPEYAEVAVEDSLEIEGTSKAPDYAFKVGRERKFYVEAKKPKVDIQYDIHPAFQLRRYAWNAHLPLSVLTDFEEFAIYNCKNKPNPTDSAATGRDLFYRYTDYVEKWDEIAAVLSKDAVWKGAFDRYADTSKGKKGTTEVDDEFLKDMSEWRNALARNIALRNPQVADEAQLNYAVQMTIDRIIFLRICEDRGIEPEEQLKSMAGKPAIYVQLVELFKRADVKYNSGLFHFVKEKANSNAVDSFTPGLKIDDKVLKEIIQSIYYPCPYIFKEIPVEILGQVYEQFLGKVIRLTAGHQAKVEEKPEVRKAGGVYYTPRYIVDYIVQNTVGKLLEGKTPEGAAKLKIVDPACGSGSFLLGAYQHLLDWHLKWYLENDAERWARGKNPALVQVIGGYKLTTEKKKEILVNNIHGVDIDAQAVEVTKLSLLLKVLEEESGQLSLGFERVLPDLGKNIQCGNSLIGEDYFEGRLPLQGASRTVDPEERRRVNPFTWETAFPEVFQQGGFDAVIGNPPYVLGRETFDDGMKLYISKKFKSFSGKYDLYIYFTDKAISLLKPEGKLGFILPNTLLANENSTKLRKIILSDSRIDTIRIFANRVFSNAQVESVIIILTKQPTTTGLIEIRVGDSLQEISQKIFSNSTNYHFNININIDSEKIINKLMKRSIPLGELTDICIGIQLGGSSKKETKESYLSRINSNPSYKKVLDGKNINPYRTQWGGMYVRYGEWLHRKRDEKYFINPKILIRQIGSVPVATYDDESYYTLNTIYNLINSSDYSLKLLLSIINSKLGKWIWRSVNSDFKEIFPKIKKTQLEKIPIRSIDFGNLDEVKQHDRIVLFVDRLLELHKRTPVTPQEQERLAREIESTDREIDRLVYELYGLSEEEIRIVEGS